MLRRNSQQGVLGSSIVIATQAKIIFLLQKKYSKKDKPIFHLLFVVGFLFKLIPSLHNPYFVRSPGYKRTFLKHHTKKLQVFKTLHCCVEFLRLNAHLRTFSFFPHLNLLPCSRSGHCIYIAIKIPSSNNATLLVQNKLLRRHELKLTFGASIYVCQSCRHVSHS